MGPLQSGKKEKKLLTELIEGVKIVTRYAICKRVTGGHEKKKKRKRRGTL